MGWTTVAEMERIPLADNSVGKTLLLVTLGMLALGVVMVHSAVASVVEPGAWYARVDFRHTAFAGLACLVLLALWRLDYRLFLRGKAVPAIPAVLLAVSLLCGVLVFGPGIGRSP